ncbi:MAG: hypothetical protein MJ211_10010 [Bacteroidales bacterium]|nr:hypothetical protein [Bacteroidales bacterium]
MARDLITVLEPTVDTTKSLASATATQTTISTTNNATIVGATGVKDNSLTIIVIATTAGTVTFKAGEYPNSVQGDLAVACEAGATAIQIQRPTRFMKKDGNIDVDFTTIAGKIFAVGKHAGLEATV